MQLAAIILAGGLSSRMGRPKESLQFGDDTLLGRTCRTLAACCTPLVVVARDRTQPLPPLPAGVTVVCDAPGAAGPLVGLAAGLRALLALGLAPDDAAFVTACDHPFLHADAVRALQAELGTAPLVMPQLGEHLQPLCAIYRVGCTAAVERLLAADGRSPRALGKEPGARILPAEVLRAIDPDLRFLTSVDTPAEFEAARRSPDRRS